MLFTNTLRICRYALLVMDRTGEFGLLNLTVLEYLLHGHGHSARELAHCKQLINPRGLTHPRLLDKLLEASLKVRENRSHRICTT